MNAKSRWKTFLFCLALPLAVGGLSAFLTRGSMKAFDLLNKPALSPPGWLFPAVWTVLYILMGTASYLVLRSKKPNGTALLTYALQLVFNFFWSLIFFNHRQYLFAFVWLAVLWLLILLTTVRFFRISKAAGFLMLPYLLWVAFAGYLNYAIYLLNP